MYKLDLVPKMSQVPALSKDVRNKKAPVKGAFLVVAGAGLEPAAYIAANVNFGLNLYPYI